MINSLRCSPGGKAAYFRALRAFYKWAYQEEVIDRSPFDKLSVPKVPKPIRQKVSIESIEVLMKACRKLRHKLIVVLLADTGLRLSELASIYLSDLILDRKIITVWGKGRKQRVVAYGDISAELLGQYLPEAPVDAPLLGMKARGIQYMLHRLEKTTGIKCNAHAFRRTFATESIRNGMNIFYVQSLLGHDSLTMTRIYAEQVDAEDAIKAYQPIVR